MSENHLADNWEPPRGEEIDLPRLRREMATAFTLGDMKVIAFDLSIGYEYLPFKNETRDEVSLALVEKCQQTGRLGELIVTCRKSRPRISWDQFTRTINPEASPYKGLEPYGVGDADLFFGREALTEELVAHVRENNFLAVVGASGSGKSSLVLAGLIPALKKGGYNWPVTLVKPTSRPLASLARELTRDSESERAALILRDDMAADHRILDSLANRLATDAGVPHFLLVVDQFEELFTLCHDEEERRFFVDNLTYAVSEDTAGSMKLVLTLRADFYHHCARYDALRALLEKQQKFIGQMSIQELRRAIEEPAGKHDLVLENGLAEMLLQDLGAVDGRQPEPGALPYFSHALLETWRRRQGNLLTVAGYAISGGVRGAVAETAEAAFLQLNSQQQAIAQSILLRLVEVEEGVPDTRRRAGLAELLPEDETGRLAVETVLDRLSKQRLITLGREEVEVAHEALIRQWPRFSQWIEQDRDGLRIHRQLTAAAQTWQGLGQPADPGELYRGKRLSDAVEWVEARNPQLSELERTFLETSRRAAAEEELRRREAAIQRELAERQRRIILTLSLADKAPSVARQGEQTELATLLALEAARLNDEGGRTMNLSVDRAMRTVLSQSYFSNILVSDRPATVQFADYSQDGRWLVTVDLDGNIHQRDLTDGRSRMVFAAIGDGVEREGTLSPDGVWLATVHEEAGVRLRCLLEEPIDLFLERGSDSGINNLAFSPDGRRLAALGGLSAGFDADIQIWNLDPLAKAPAAQWSNVTGAEELCFSPNTRWFAAYGSYSANIYLWDLKSEGNEPAWLWSLEESIKAPLFSPDSRWLVVRGGYDRAEIQLRDLERINEGPVWQTTYHTPVGGAAFSPDGWLAISGDRAMYLFDLAQPGTAPFELAVDQAVDQPFDLVAFSPEGTLMAAANHYGSIAIWKLDDLDAGPFLHDLGKPYFDSLAFSPDGQLLVAGDSSALIHLWRLGRSRDLEKTYTALKGHAFYLFDLLFTRDGRRLISRGHDPMIRLWHLNKPVAEPQPLSLPSRSACWSVAFSSDGRWLAAGLENDRVAIWPSFDSNPRYFTRHRGSVWSVAFSPGSDLLASVDEGGQLLIRKVVDTEDRPIVLSGRTTVAFSKDGRWLAAAGKDQGICLWPADDLESAFIQLGKDASIMSLDFSHDSRWLASANTDGAIRIYDLEQPGKEPLTLREQYNPTGDVVFSPDDRWLASGGTDREVTLWPLDNPDSRPIVLHRQQGWVNGIRFSPDGLWLASGSAEGLVHLWDMADLAAEPALLVGHDGPVRDIAISPDSRWLVSAGVDGQVLRWPLLKKLLEDARQMVMRGLTEEEWRRYLPGEEYQPRNPALTGRDRV